MRKPKLLSLLSKVGRTIPGEPYPTRLARDGSPSLSSKVGPVLSAEIYR